MSAEIPKELVDRMMVRCARRCCICRRFRPTKLQVHHIVERSQGGTDEEDNLIVVCFSCHSDVHTKVPFARRFSVEELKGHRDALAKMVEEGRFPTTDTDDADEVMAEVVRALRASAGTEVTLIPEAAELLLSAATSGSNRQGLIFASTANVGLRLSAGDRHDFLSPGDRRAEAKYRHALDTLVNLGLVERESESMFWVTHPGYLAADEIMVSRAQPPTNV